MDKETLSNYGWIVICVLVLAVMIALATPFGDYISTAVKSTTQGLFDTNKNALNSTGLINIGDQSFSDGTDTGDSGNGNQAATIKREAGSVIPDGATYTKADGTTLEGNGTNTFPDAPTAKDTYEEGDYKYTFSNTDSGWSVAVKTVSQSEYGAILHEISGRQIVSLMNTFKNCKLLVTAPEIPGSVTNMASTFYNCTSLLAAPEIPSNVTNMNYTFNNCTSLTTAPEIPNGVTQMTFTFSNCTSLTTASAIPDSVIYMNNIFSGCELLTTAPKISNRVTNMSYAFQNCRALTTAPVIPSSVTNLEGTFYFCLSLKGSIEINSNPSKYDNCLGRTQITAVTGSTTLKAKILATK